MPDIYTVNKQSDYLCPSMLKLTSTYLCLDWIISYDVDRTKNIVTVNYDPSTVTPAGAPVAAPTNRKFSGNDALILMAWLDQVSTTVSKSTVL